MLDFRNPVLIVLAEAIRIPTLVDTIRILRIC